MEQNFILLSKSTSGDPYTITFYLQEKVISAYCSCPAGEHRKLCKHILHMIDGDASILYDSNQKPILEKICSHIESTPVPLLFSELTNKETLLKRAQQEVKKAKKNIEKHLIGK